MLQSFLSRLLPVPDAAVAAVIAIAETTRAVRWVNVALGFWLMMAPLILSFAPLHIGVRSSLVGAAILGLSLIEGPKRETQGGGWRRLWDSESTDATGSAAGDGRRPHGPEPGEWRKTG